MNLLAGAAFYLLFSHVQPPENVWRRPSIPNQLNSLISMSLILEPVTIHLPPVVKGSKSPNKTIASIRQECTTTQVVRPYVKDRAVTRTSIVSGNETRGSLACEINDNWLHRRDHAQYIRNPYTIYPCGVGIGSNDVLTRRPFPQDFG